MHRRLLPYLLVVSCLVGCDHATKHLAKTHLPTAAVDVIDGLVRLTYVENTDVAFGVLRWIPSASLRRVVILAGNVVILGLRLWYWRREERALRVREQRSVIALTTRFGLSLIIAGALGNMIDRAARGFVVDFIHVRWWPVFNIADICVVVGVGLLLLANLGAPRSLDQRVP